MVLMIEKEPFPLSFSVEVGAYINTIRSSLDILATALAHRHNIPNPDTHSFPVAKDLNEFTSGKGFKGEKFLQALPQAQRTIIASLKPYQGGDDVLYALHKLNHMSKHQRLLTVAINPAMFKIQGWFGFISLAGEGWLEGGNGEIALGFISKQRSNVKTKFIPHVTLNE